MENKVMTETSILFVDDEDVIRKSLARELREEHFTVTAVSSGSEAISALQAAQYDLVITDLAVFEIDKKSGGVRLIELAPQVSVEEVRAKTEADFEAAMAAA